MNKNLQLIVSLTLGILLGSFGFYWFSKQTPTAVATPAATNKQLSTTTSLSVTPKDSPEAPDLVVNQKYVATINSRGTDHQCFSRKYYLCFSNFCYSLHCYCAAGSRHHPSGQPHGSPMGAWCRLRETRR